MKKLIIIALLFLGFNSYAQTNEIKVYKNGPGGLPSINPVQIITPENNGSYNVYETKNGLPNINPSQIVVPNLNGGYDVYQTKNGIPDITPSETIIIEEPNYNNYVY